MPETPDFSVHKTHFRDDEDMIEYLYQALLKDDPITLKMCIGDVQKYLKKTDYNDVNHLVNNALIRCLFKSEDSVSAHMLSNLESIGIETSISTKEKKR